VTVLPKDLTEPKAADEIAASLFEASIPVDVLVNNAGFGLQGPFISTDLQDELDMLQVNVTALTHLTKLMLPGMLSRKAGGVLNVASTAAFQPGPLMAVYYASKAYVLALSEALTEELRGTGVTVTALCPGATHTAFQQRAGLDRARIFRAGVMDAPRVARVGYRGFRRGRAIVIPGMKNNILACAAQVAPRGLVRRIVHVLNGKTRG